MLLLASLAAANGLQTHVWITMEARSLLPPGDLADLVADPANEQALRNGAQFPDGGYAVNDGYGEMAHWEPLQGRLLDWIRATYGPPPYTGEGAEHVAFLLGMASHGMGDQVFDGNYIERVRDYDAEAADWSTSFDEATDVAWAAITGGQPTPELWIPEVMPQLFADAGHDVTMDTLEQGQTLTALAVTYVTLAGQNPDAVAEYEAQWPWATTHLEDPAAIGRPAQEAQAVAWYWQALWARLQGDDDFDPPVLGTFPHDGQYGQPTSADSVESRVVIVFSRGLYPESLPTGSITVADGTGRVYEPEVEVYYGTDSHVVLLRPYEDWASDQDFVVTVQPTPTSIAGVTMAEPYTFTFSTRPPPPDDTGPADTGWGADEGCGCATGTGGPAWLLAGLAALGARRRG